MSSAGTPRTIADQLRGWADDRLVGLLSARPDLQSPTPHDSAQLAARAASPASLHRALDQLTAAELAVLTRVVATSPTSVSALCGDLTGSAGQIEECVQRLLELVLVWEAPDGLRALTGVTGRLGQVTPGVVPDAPPVLTSERDPALVDRIGAGAAFETARRIELLLDQWSTRPPAVLRSGGLGIRELRSAAATLHADEPVTALLVEVAAGAGLLASGLADGESVWLPTDAYDEWLALPIERRWTQVVGAWLDGSRVPGLVGTKDEGSGRTRNALAPELVSAHAAETRRATLGILAALPPGRALASGTGTASVVARLGWERPRRPLSRGELAVWTLREAAVLGVTGLDSLTGPGRLLLAGDLAAAATLVAPALPDPVDQVLIQADLTAVAPGPLVADRAAALHLLADVESRGGATVYRFTRDSVRRGFDAGWTAAEVHDFLSRVSRTAVPQPLAYLVDDVERSFGTMRIGQAESYLRSDDETALTELMHLPQATSWSLRRIAPTVVVSPTPLDVLLPRLRELGLAPAIEAPDGSIRVARPVSLRARTPRERRPPAADEAREAARLRAVVATVRAGDRAADDRAVDAPSSPGEVLALLRNAVESRLPVVIGYVDRYGTSGERAVDPVSVEAGTLTAFDRASEDTRTFPLSRITGVRPAAR